MLNLLLISSSLNPRFIPTNHRKRLGAEVSWKPFNLEVSENFGSTGDLARNSLKALQAVIDGGVSSKRISQVFALKFLDI